MERSSNGFSLQYRAALVGITVVLISFRSSVISGFRARLGFELVNCDRLYPEITVEHEAVEAFKAPGVDPVIKVVDREGCARVDMHKRSQFSKWIGLCGLIDIGILRITTHLRKRYRSCHE
ncbi:hypothetical protein Droror1_Dr00007643 [Drosera rotundifolia]